MSAGAVLGLAGLAAAIIALVYRRKGQPQPPITLPVPDLQQPDHPPPLFPDPPPADAPHRSAEEVAAALDEAAAKHKPPLQWRTSIVDLLKAAGEDSSEENRRMLAEQAGFKGYDPRQAAHNIDLHKLVLEKLKDPALGGLDLGT